MSEAEPPRLRPGLIQRVSWALRWRCPECGGGAMFRPLREVHGYGGWHLPVERCGACQLPFQREPGYYLLATWALGYGATGLLGLALFAATWSLPIEQAMWIVLPPLPVFALAFARHAKALFLAFDWWADPPAR